MFAAIISRSEERYKSVAGKISVLAGGCGNNKTFPQVKSSVYATGEAYLKINHEAFLGFLIIN